MSEDKSPFYTLDVPNQAAANEAMDRLFAITKPDVVYSQPITVGDHTIITASEYTAGLGLGYGGGSGFDEKDSGGSGGGGGGGGMTTARPVASIIISPQGVRVEPIVDPTKIVLAFFTAFGAMWIALSRMRRQAKKME